MGILTGFDLACYYNLCSINILISYIFNFENILESIDTDLISLGLTCDVAFQGAKWQEKGPCS